MRFQAKPQEPTVYTFIQQATQWKRLGPFKWVGYQDTDHDFCNPNGEPLLQRDLLFQHWRHQDRIVDEAIFSSAPNYQEPNPEPLLILGCCEGWVRLAKTSLLRFLPDNRFYDDKNNLLLRYVPEHNEWLSNNNRYRNYHFSAIIIATKQKIPSLSTGQIPYRNR